MTFGSHSSCFFKYWLIKSNSSNVILYHKYPNIRNLHLNLFTFSHFVWKKSKNLFTTISTCVFWLHAIRWHLCIIYLHLWNNAIRSFDIIRSYLSSSIMSCSCSKCHSTHKILSNYEHRNSCLIISFLWIGSSLLL